MVGPQYTRISIPTWLQLAIITTGGLILLSVFIFSIVDDNQYESERVRTKAAQQKEANRMAAIQEKERIERQERMLRELPKRPIMIAGSTASLEGDLPELPYVMIQKLALLRPTYGASRDVRNMTTLTCEYYDLTMDFYAKDGRLELSSLLMGGNSTHPGLNKYVSLAGLHIGDHYKAVQLGTHWSVSADEDGRIVGISYSNPSIERWETYE